MKSSTAYLFIINPHSGTKLGKGLEDIVSSIENQVKSAGYEVSCVTTTQRGHATKLVHDAIASSQKWRAVVAVGGDGTVNEVARGLLHSDTPLGIIPLGSGNGLARHLRIPLSLSKALARILEGNTRLIDSAEINGNPFFCTSGLGFDAWVSHQFASHHKRGLWSYVQISWNAFWSYLPQSYSLGSNRIKAFSICFANAGQFGNNAWIAPHADISDGKLELCIINPFPKWFGGIFTLQMFTRRLSNSRYVNYEPFTRLDLKTDTPAIIHYDGEPYQLDSEEITVKTIPQSLRVIC